MTSNSGIKASTIRTYKTIVNRLFKQAACRKNITNQSPSAVEVARLLISRAAELRPKTWCMYRTAFNAYLRQQRQTNDIKEAHDILNNAPPSMHKGVGIGQYSSRFSRSSLHRRTFSKKDFQNLINELTGRTCSRDRDKRFSLSNSQLTVWLLAAHATGLRPIEWKDAKWTSTKDALIVTTAKQHYVNQKNNPQTIAVRLVSVDKKDRLMVDVHMSYVDQHLESGANFDSYYKKIRKQLWRVSEHLFGRQNVQGKNQRGVAKFTLYMMRGQFAANKKWEQGVEAAAGLMGCSTNVASTHYGRARNAHRTIGRQMPMRQIQQRQQTTEVIARIYRPRN